ncbi:flavin reductase family protein [Stappia indica]|uniref:flavin reductase family protein n=1 Tax=Stappia indica TaxID=538381 RepID=UPI001CD735B5|nr:flavin reductase family protein [Stappia indica]MCA1299776.1 flavin reductase family protein [Stappia indica]
MSTDHRSLRNALGRFVTGVTIVTTVDASGRPVGLTANSFNSVSLDPPMVLWSLARTSRNMATFEGAGHYAINILASDQTGLSNRFARPEQDRFERVDWQMGACGVPVLAGVTAVFECRNSTRVDGGDHVVFLGQVEAFDHADREPLIYHGGRYATPHYGISSS